MPKVLAFLRSLQGSQTPPAPEMDAESKAWLDDSAAEMLEALQAIEADAPPGAVEEWLDAMWKASKPVRFNPETGDVEDIAS